MADAKLVGQDASAGAVFASDGRVISGSTVAGLWNSAESVLPVGSDRYIFSGTVGRLSGPDGKVVAEFQGPNWIRSSRFDPKIWTINTGGNVELWNGRARRWTVATQPGLVGGVVGRNDSVYGWSESEVFEISKGGVKVLLNSASPILTVVASARGIAVLTQDDLTLVTGNRTTRVTPPNGLPISAIDGDGTSWLVGTHGGDIYRVSTAGKWSMFRHLFAWPNGIVASEKYVFIADSGGSVNVYSKSGSEIAVYGPHPTGGSFGELAANSDGSRLVARYSGPRNNVSIRLDLSKPCDISVANAQSRIRARDYATAPTLFHDYVSP